MAKGQTRSNDYSSVEADTMQATKSSPFIDICTKIMENCRCPREQLEEVGIFGAFTNFGALTIIGTLRGHKANISVF